MVVDTYSIDDISENKSSTDSSDSVFPFLKVYFRDQFTRASRSWDFWLSDAVGSLTWHYPNIYWNFQKIHLMKQDQAVQLKYKWDLRQVWIDKSFVCNSGFIIQLENSISWTGTPRHQMAYNISWLRVSFKSQPKEAMLNSFELFTCPKTHLSAISYTVKSSSSSVLVSIGRSFYIWQINFLILCQMW